MKKKIETPQQIWKNLNNEWNKIFDNFKYLNEPDRILFLNIIIGESVNFSNIRPLNVIGLLNQICFDVQFYIKNNLSIALGNQEMRKYVG